MYMYNICLYLYIKLQNIYILSLYSYMYNIAYSYSVYPCM